MLVFLPLDRLSLEARADFLALTKEVFDACNTFDLHANGERLLAIWAYQSLDSNDRLRSLFKLHAGYLFTKFGESLIATQDPSQMVLDIMALMCIARLFTTGSATTYCSPILCLDYIIKAPPCHACWVVEN